MFEPMRLTYLLGLLISIGGLGFIDWRFGLLFARNRRAALETMGLGMVVFVLWDMLGMRLGVFRLVPSGFTTHIVIWPGMPLEELIFFVLLCYQTLILWSLLTRRRRHD